MSRAVKGKNTSRVVKKAEDSIIEVSETLENGDVTEDERVKLADIVVALTKALNQLKQSNYDYKERSNAQLQIMNKLKQLNEDKDRTIALLSKNKGNELKNNKEILSLVKNVNKDVSEEFKMATKRKYDNYLNEWLGSIDEKKNKKS